jgi:hypothetical protein
MGALAIDAFSHRVFSGGNVFLKRTLFLQWYVVRGVHSEQVAANFGFSTHVDADHSVAPVVRCF